MRYPLSLFLCNFLFLFSLLYSPFCIYTWVSHRMTFILFPFYGISVFILIVFHFSLSPTLLFFFMISLSQSLSLLLSFLWLYFILFYFLIAVSNFLILLNFIWLVIWFDILCDILCDFELKSVIFRTVLLIVMSDIVFSLITIYLSAWSDRTNVGCPSWSEWSCQINNWNRGSYRIKR